ncbi:hypothetical protein R1sor_016385 [Riccia sorocarpa]|uniref:Rhodanese domain-containing protein n=1 Tax=Riccia sorocarpa TaxID=122646 RepID=A0ABD3HGQ1_9MARC
MAAVVSSVTVVSAASLGVSSSAEADGLSLSAAATRARGILLRRPSLRVQIRCQRSVVQARAPEFSRRLIRLQANARGEEYATTVRSVPVQVARELLNAGHRFLDVRTAEEYAAGHIEGAVNVPYMHRVGPGMSKNLKFMDEVRQHFHKDSEIVVGCKSGRRSLMAAHEMEAAGDFTGVTDMVGGFDAWVESGLPTRALHA